MSSDIDGQTYTGLVVRTSSGESFGLMQQYGKRGIVSTGTMASVGSTAMVKAILSSPAGSEWPTLRVLVLWSGRWWRCVDDQGRMLDAIVSR